MGVGSGLAQPDAEEPDREASVVPQNLLIQINPSSRGW
jgi:hypothetical protein